MSAPLTAARTAPTAASRPAALAAAAASVLGISMLGAAALTLAAPAHAESDRVFGQVTSVSDGSFQVNRPDGTAGTVNFTAATTVSQGVPAQRTDITVGSCIKAGDPGEPVSPDATAVTAEWVMISTPVDGQCPQWRGQPAADGADGHPGHRGARGIVDSVSGDTVNITRTAADGTRSQVAVTLTDTTTFRKRVPADASAIAVGKCTASRGTLAADGVLNADRVSVWDSKDGTCPRPGR